MNGLALPHLNRQPGHQTADLSERRITPPAEPIIDLQGAAIGYGKTIVLQGVNLRVQPGERLALIGPSGAGKTTLLSRLYQLLPDQASFIQQQYGLVRELSVFHNIFMGRLDMHSRFYNLRNLIHPARPAVREVGQVAAQLGIGELLQVKVGKLSGGQQQRVAVGRALYRGSPVILADEPVASVDPLQGADILARLMATNRTVITALHSVAFAKRFAGRVIGIREGKLVFDCSPDALNERRVKDLFAAC